MSDALMITCPSCKSQFALDETLAGPMIAKVRTEAETRIREWEKAHEKQRELDRQKAEEVAHKEKEISEREAALQTQVNQAIAKERAQIAKEERANALRELQPEREAERAMVNDLQQKLAQAQAEELGLRKEKSALEQREKSLELEIARQVDSQTQIDSGASVKGC